VLAPDELQTNSDRRALKQILINLTNNAIKFTDQGAVGLELSRLEDERGWVTRFNVTDTGRGIEAHDQERLFAEFEQVGTRSYEGSGLGLHICRALAGLIGATISFQSEYGKGSVFTLDVPN
jgi:signal transduction histidine kinase